MFTKIFGSILNSSIWLDEDGHHRPMDVKLVWLTMLIMANEFGIVEATAAGIAKESGVLAKRVREIIDLLINPDPESRTPDNQGRRIEKVEGGWLVLNHEKYRSIRNRKQMVDAARQRRHRASQP